MMSQTYERWIRGEFEGLVISLTDEWEIGEQICEKCFYFSAPWNKPAFSEASAVYHCRQVKGSIVGKEAIMKIRLQAPVEEYHSDPRVRAQEVIPIPPDVVMREITSLNYLTLQGCSVAPKLIDWTKFEQTDTDLVPGGFVVIVIMEKLPGKSLGNYHTYPDEEKAGIRDAFRESLMEIKRHGVHLEDERPHNLHWDAKTGKCYILDYEFVSYFEPHTLWDGEDEFIEWGMAYWNSKGECQFI